MLHAKSLAVLLLVGSVVFLPPVHAQTKDDIQRALDKAFQVAKTNDTKTDLTEAGSVLVLQMDSIVMSKSSLPVPGNVYRDGKLKPEGVLAMTAMFSNNNQQQATHAFHAGDKFFVTAIEARKDAVSFTFMSDVLPVLNESDQRFRASLKFPYPKGSIPSAADVLAQVAAVVKIDNPAPEAAAPAPRSTAAPQVIKLGMSRDRVIATFGVPTKVAHVSGKEIDTYPDMKVTFVNGKVADVQ